MTSAEIFDLLSDKDRARRAAAGRSIAGVLARHTRLFALITNTLAKDKQIEDGWRRFARPISSRNLANQVEDEVVDALIAAVKEAYPRLSHRYCAQGALARPRAGVLGPQRAAARGRRPARRLAEAKVIVLDAYRRFAPPLAAIVERFFGGNWIDAALRRARMRARSAIRPCRACIPTC